MSKYAEYEKLTKELHPETFEFWNPEAGEGITGEITDIVTLNGQYGDHKVINLRDGNDKLWCINMSTRIKQEVEGQKLGRGCVIGVKYHGTKPTKNGGRYKDFAVTCFERPERKSSENFEDDIPF